MIDPALPPDWATEARQLLKTIAHGESERPNLLLFAANCLRAALVERERLQQEKDAAQDAMLKLADVASVRRVQLEAAEDALHALRERIEQVKSQRRLAQMMNGEWIEVYPADVFSALLEPVETAQKNETVKTKGRLA